MKDRLDEDNQFILDLKMAEDTTKITDPNVTPVAPTSYDVEVKITYDPATGLLSKEVTNPDNGFVFTNKYSTKDSAGLEAKKVLNGRTLVAGEFSFKLTDTTNNIEKTYTNAADGTIAIDQVYKYAINPSDADVADGY